MKQIMGIFLLLFLLAGCTNTVTENTGGMQQSAEQDSQTTEQTSLSDTFQASTAEETDEKKKQGIIPAAVNIPAISVEAAVNKVGRLPSGKMGEPENVEDVGWYGPGYRPGEQGSAVLAGHVDSKTGPAVFFELEKLKAGDEIIVRGNNGEQETFIVQNQKSYDRSDAPVEEIFGWSYRRQLKLITCTGEFNENAGTHEKRLVVYAVHKEDTTGAS
ncbi:class F sortase [Salibacterium halotolerans]|uniref:LPXTG-site transpeptidase (Sortase) family protein n=1 Tax=Salibacterium halotolerans TaxID=1884432 RepID=A0A1I5U0F6_9BACI|nr:class F sortase [Salibacterium halotolerans]SFP88661.1 LPXTG-site transpeptidase (sortase) family protein [Salibacterium halotolerans]